MCPDKCKKYIRGIRFFALFALKKRMHMPCPARYGLPYLGRSQHSLDIEQMFMYIIEGVLHRNAQHWVVAAWYLQ